MRTLTSVISASILCGFSAHAFTQNPQPNWKDSYSVDGKCYCDSSNFDHGLDTKTAPTPIGELNVQVICADIEAVLGEGPTEDRIPYNDIQCGNGPANDAIDEVECPGRVDMGSAGCNIIGPKWDLVSVYGPWGETPDYLDRGDWVLSTSSNEQDAYNAIDGTNASRWATGSVQTPGQFFVIDMGIAQSFDTLVMETPSNPFDYPRGYSVYISDDGSNWGSPIASGSGISETTSISFDTVTASYIRIEQTGSDSQRWWSISEINLVAAESSLPPTPESEPEPEPGSAIDSSSWVLSSNRSVGGSFAIENAIDESESTRWATKEAQQAGQYFQVDLGETFDIGSIELRTEKNPDDYPREYEVVVSNDGESWSDSVASGFGNGAITTIGLSASARFVRIIQLGSSDNNWWSIHDMDIYTASSDTNKLDETDWTFSASQNNGDAELANDSVDNTRWTTEQTQRDGQYFQIDLASSQSFSRIILDSSSSNLDQPRTYEVFVSNDTNNWGSVIATGNGNPNGLTQIDFGTQSARYIRIVQSGSDSSHWWSIHELDVFLID